RPINEFAIGKRSLTVHAPADQHWDDHPAPALGQTPRELALWRNAAGQSGELLGGLVGVRHSNDICDRRAIDRREQQSFSSYVSECRPARGKHLVVFSASKECPLDR